MAEQVAYGQKGQKTGVPKQAQARNQRGPNRPDPNDKPHMPNQGSDGTQLPALSPELQQRLDKQFAGQKGFGPASGPTQSGVRRLMREGLAAGLSERAVSAFLNPAFYRGINDPSGGNKLLRDLTPDQLTALSKYAASQKGTGLVDGGSTDAQAAFFAAFPDLQQKYISIANSYKKPFDPGSLTGGTTPPNAVLGSDGLYHDPYMALPEGVTIEGGPLTRPQPGTGETRTGGTGEGIFQPFTNMTGTQQGVAGYPLQSFTDYGTAMTAAQTMLASHYASAAAAGDFASAGTAFKALQDHQSFMQPQAPTISSPDTFGESDLFPQG